MTTIGHCLTGMSLGVLCLPNPTKSKSITALQLFCFAGLANIPDWPLPMWGHHRYDISHSLIVNGAMMLLALLVFGLWKKPRNQLGGWLVVLCGTAAWLSHFFLDSLYNHGLGLGVLWPVSEWRLNLSVPWFSTLNGWWAWDLHTARVAAIELAVYGSLLAMAILGRRLWLKRREA